MITSKSEKSIESVCDFTYLSEMMDGKTHLIKEIMDAFLKQVPEELQAINNAITKTDYATIKSFAHTMKSSVSIMGISVLTPILQEMEDLAIGIGHSGIHQIERIMELNQKLGQICKRAIEEIEKEKHLYI